MAAQPPIPPSAPLTPSSAKMDAIAVRIVMLPENDTAQDTAPQKLTGLVTGQASDGSLRIMTERGMAQIMLRDKGNLPEGTAVEIEIPAGRNPQSAALRPSSIPPQTLAQTLSNQATASSQHNPPLSNPDTIPAQIPTPRLNASTLGSVLQTHQGLPTTPLTPSSAIAGGALQAGQMLRLVPLSPQSLSPALLKNLSQPMPMSTLLSGLVQMIESLPRTQTQLRTQLITLLARIDRTPLKNADTTPPAPSFSSAPSSSSPHSAPTGQTGLSNSALIGKIETLIRSIGLNPSAPLANPTPPSTTAPTIPTTPLSVSPSKPLDAQVMMMADGQTEEPILFHSSSPQTQSSQTTQRFANAPVMPAQILGMDEAGLPILSLPLSSSGALPLYTLQFRATNFSAGTPLFLALDTASLAQTDKPNPSQFFQSTPTGISLAPTTTPSVLFKAFGETGTWDTLDTLLKTVLQNSGDITTAQKFTSLLPSPAQPQNFSALSLLFLSVIRSGAFDEWIPAPTQTFLKTIGKLDALRAVTQDLSLAGKMDTLTLPQDWRMTPLPLFFGQDIQRTNLYYKHYPEDKDEGENEQTRKRRKLRFLFDLQLSRMGDVQVDGFMQTERLDIILRTRTPLSRPMQSQMKQLYAGAVEKSRLIGDLSFQFRPEHWVDFSKPFEKSGLLT